MTEVKQIAEEAYTYAFPMLMGPLRASPMMDTIHKCYLLNQGCSLLHIQCIYFQRRGICNRKQPLSAYGSLVAFGHQGWLIGPQPWGHLSHTDLT